MSKTVNFTGTVKKERPTIKEIIQNVKANTDLRKKEKEIKAEQNRLEQNRRRNIYLTKKAEKIIKRLPKKLQRATKRKNAKNYIKFGAGSDLCDIITYGGCILIPGQYCEINLAGKLVKKWCTENNLTVEIHTKEITGFDTSSLTYEYRIYW